MTINFNTQSGSLYKIYEKNGKTFISRGASFDAEIVRLKRPIELGGTFEADVKKYNMYMKAEEDTTFVCTSKIVRLEITL